MRKPRSRIGSSRLPPLPPLILLFLCLLASLPPCLLSQDSGTARDAWQRPAEVMDALGISSGDVVADVGAGNGYFTFHIAGRVGPAGRVYAVEIDEEALDKIKQRARKERLGQIESILGATNDPRLPTDSLDAVLIVNAYHEMREYDSMLAALFRALRPGGRLGVIDAATEPGEDRETYFRRHRVPAELVREDAERSGFRFLRRRPGFTRPRDNREFWFLLFEKPAD
ncbi:MAG: methyltransferase domain-containing protein [Candidatus Acidiferrales bacterium]